ncbi:MAG: serine hydrolase [Oscillospiraceae bacterium]|nr:serine hydrolase [Oscillospiraceae bacterium]
MDIKMQVKALEMLQKIKGSDKNDREFVPQKPLLKPVKTNGVFRELSPGQAGVRSEGLLKMLNELSESENVLPHSILVLKDGALIAKADFKPFLADIPHVSHSLCKSIVSMAVGLAANEGRISVDEKIAEIFAEYMPRNAVPQMKSVTVRHLLTMSSGAVFNEAKALVSGDWVRDFLASEIMFEPGTGFHYNSLNTYMLSAAVCMRTGMSLSEYLRSRLFDKMDIRGFYWEKCPHGIEKGGWGLYMGIYDYAKLGQLYLDGGVWNGKRLIPQSWINESLSRHIADEGYGYQIWLTDDGFAFSGMFGQNVYVFPRRRMVIAITAGSTSVFPRGRSLDIISGFIRNDENFSGAPIRDPHGTALKAALEKATFGKALPVKGKPRLLDRLRSSLYGARNFNGIPEAARVLSGSRIDFEENSAGLLPVLIQFMNGNFEHGINRADFLAVGDRFTVSLHGDGGVTRIPVSFGDTPEYFDLNRRGEVYRVGTMGRFTTDEDDIPVLKLTLCFVETSCTKLLKFIFHESGVVLKVRESPRLYDALDEGLEVFLPTLGSAARKTVAAVLETEAADSKIRNILEPTLKGKFVQ